MLAVWHYLPDPDLARDFKGVDYLGIGEAYLIDLDAHNVIEARWDHQSCRMNVDMRQTQDPLPDLGTFICTLRLP